MTDEFMEPQVVSEAVEAQINHTKSLETLAWDLVEPLKLFAQAFAAACAGRDMSDLSFRTIISGRPDGEIKITFETSTYDNGAYASIDGYNNPVALIHELFRRIDANRTNARPLITHRR